MRETSGERNPAVLPIADVGMVREERTEAG
jgi:hypothetical protein